MRGSYFLTLYVYGYFLLHLHKYLNVVINQLKRLKRSCLLK